MKSKKDFYVISLSALSMLIGGLLYLFYRPHSLLMFSWLKYIHCDQIFKYRHVRNESLLTGFIIYSLPNGLWLFSGLLLFGLIWRSYSKYFFLYLSILVIESMLFELFQMDGIIPGKFDVFDVLSLIFFGFLGYVFYIFVIRRKSQR